MQEFLFLFKFDDSLCFVEFNIFVCFNDNWDVAMNLNIVIGFLGVQQCYALYFNLSVGNSVKKYGKGVLKLRILFKNFLKLLIKF